jgi:hypothetical protein
LTPISSNSNALRLIALVPFAYQAISRMAAWRTVIHYAATQVLPTIWIVYRLSDLSLADSVLAYAIGLFAFVALYEIGYIANDTWDAARDPQGRQRAPFAVDGVYLAAFVAIRLTVWSAIGAWTGWLYDVPWLVGYLCLGVVFTLHNVISSGAVRSGTFVQLAVWRIVLPGLGAIGVAQIGLVLTVAIFLYAYFRHLSYLDSKTLLAMPERSEAFYPLTQAAIFLPMAAFVSVAMSNTLFLELAAYFIAFYGANALLRLR